MISFLFLILAGLVGGLAAGLQAPFTGMMGQRVGELGSVLITYGGGALLILLLTLASGQHQLSEWRTIPWYAFLAGPLGLIIIGTISYTVPRLGAASTTTLFVLAWLLLSVIIDRFGWFGTTANPISLSRAAGVLALLLGTWLVVR